MNQKELDETWDQLMKAAKSLAGDRLDDAEIEDTVQGAFKAFYEKGEDNIDYPKTYLNHSVRNAVKNKLRQANQRKTDQLAEQELAELESSLTVRKRHAALSPGRSVLQTLADEYPDQLQSLEKSIKYIELLYFLKENLSAAREYIFPLVRSMNALKEAKAKIDALGRFLPAKVLKTLYRKFRKSHPLPDDFPDLSSELAVFDNIDPQRAIIVINYYYENIKPHPKELSDFNRNYSFYVDIGWKISKKLEDQISELHEAIAFELSGPRLLSQDFSSWNPKDVTKLDDRIMDSIPRLRADPAMLLLRVLYKMFRIGNGRYRNQKTVEKLMLELKERKKATKQESLFDSITAETNFETLRKKIYKKAKDSFYDKLASEIYSTCSKPTTNQRHLFSGGLGNGPNKYL